MVVKRISSGSRFERLAGYCRAVVVADAAGKWVFVSGTTGFDYDRHTISDDVVEQTEQCFANIERALAAAGASLADLVRIRVFLADAADVDAILPVIGARCRAHPPANTTVVSRLVDPRMKIEIEVTARTVSR